MTTFRQETETTSASAGWIAEERLARLNHAANDAEHLNGRVPYELIEDIRETARQMIDAYDIVDYGQLAVVALADAYHFVGDKELIEPALKVVDENPAFDNETSEPINKAVKRIAQTGISAIESVNIERSMLKHIPAVSSDEGNGHVYTRPIGPEYDFLFDGDIRYPDTPIYRYGGIHESIPNPKGYPKTVKKKSS